MMAGGVDEEAGLNTFNQAWELWFGPEIERRQQAGRLPMPVSLSKMQVLFADDTAHQIRLNEEVHAKLIGRVSRPVRLGEEILLDELEQIHGVELTDPDADAGHLTFFRQRDRWHMAFDFRRNGRRSRQLLARAREFLDSAARDLEAGAIPSACVMLWGAVEQMAKAELQLHDREIAVGRSHELRVTRYMQWARLGNTKLQYAELLRYLSHVRLRALYLEPGALPTPKRAAVMLRRAEEMYVSLDRYLPPRRA
jgi:HEPN domain-containing protein